MGITKQWISELLEKADAGDKESQDTLRRAALWETEEESREREAEYHHSIDQADLNTPTVC